MNLTRRSIENQELVSGELKKHIASTNCKHEPLAQSCDTGQRITFLNSCQSTIRWMSSMKLSTDCIPWTPTWVGECTYVRMIFVTTRMHRLNFITYGALLRTLRVRELYYIYSRVTCKRRVLVWERSSHS